MKQLLFCLFVLCAQFVKAQMNPNKVYAREKTPVKIDLPTNRTVYGGTIINVTCYTLVIFDGAHKCLEHKWLMQ